MLIWSRFNGFQSDQGDGKKQMVGFGRMYRLWLVIEKIAEEAARCGKMF